MRTEELVRARQRLNGLGVSLALEDRVPPKWGIFDERGEPTSLSSAGYVLHFGHTYELRVAPSAEGERLPDIRLASRPNWVIPVGEARIVEEKGQRYVSLAFEVRRQTSWVWLYYIPREIYSTGLDIEFSNPSSNGSTWIKVVCPVLARSRWLIQLILLGTLGAMLFAVGDLLLHHGVRAIYELVTTGEMADPWPIPWIGLVIGGILSPAIALLGNIMHMHSRSRQLQKEFRQRWPTAGAS
jgi:hypothetical protein